MSHWLKIQNGCHTTLMRSLCLLIGWFSSCLNSSMERTKVMPHKGEGKREVEMMQKKVSMRRGVKIRISTCHSTGTPLPVHPHCQHQKPLWDQKKYWNELQRQSSLGRWRSPQSLPTQQLAQMAAEAGTSTLDGEEPAPKKLHPTVGGKAPRKSSWRPRYSRKPRNTNQGQLLFVRSAGFKRAQSSSFRNSPSHG